MTIRVAPLRLLTLGLVFFFASANHLALGQGAKVTSPAEPISDADRDHPKQREEWFMRGRRVPGQSAAALRHRAHQQKIQMRARKSAAQNTSATSLNAFNSAWTPLGPAPLASDASGSGLQDYGFVSGRATSVAIDPADSTGNTVYIGGAYGGVWKSTNAGSDSQNPASITWTPVIDNQPTLAVGSIAIQPQLSNPDPTRSLVLVGTGEANSSADSYYGLGFLRSTDGGNTWSLISTSDGGALSLKGLGATKIAFSRAQTNTVVASLATAAAGFIDGAFTQSTVRGLYTSTDAGLTWTHQTPLDGTVPIDPTSATAVVYNEAAATFYAAIRFHGFYSSPDGLHWTRITNQPGGSVLSTTACPAVSTSVQTPCPMYRGEFAVVPGRNEMYVWYVSISTATGQEVDRGIWRSIDGGNTWTRINEAGLTNCGDVAGGCGVQQGAYNLELAAVPNGTATDLYAGAVNLFKCTLANSSSIGCTQSNASWRNLTHVYGCSSIAKVHPDQHGIDFILASGKELMYFANDGGIYRALDGFVGLTTGSCAGSNQFDSLNQKLGSMTQFVSFSIDPNDANTILGGTQDNGSPASSQATTNTPWINVNGGDGGYNAITPSSHLDWFVSNPDVPPHGLEIDHCSLGANCHTLDFSRGAVVTSSQLGGDDGGFYFPYILDPQADHELLVGTCRVWRGGPSTSAGTYTALSNNFEVGGSSICTGGEVNQVRALAAGGPKDSSGFSNVIYAGTDGLGPLDSFGSGLPPGGRVFITTNAAGGPGTFVERTQNINPNSYPVSSIAIDTSDPTGQTAYVAIMGFGAPHVWQTTNAGQTWTDFTGNLPDAPANSLVVDPGTDPTTGTIFVGTDVGVFSSSTASSNWTEVGPLVPDASGFLPNVPVTALRMFTSAGTKKLRACTYGRGMWENVLVSTPDYEMAILNPAQTVFPTSHAIFDGTITPVNGYNSRVALSCAKGTTAPPSTCTPNPSLTPIDGGTFSVTAAAAIGDYFFDVHAVGTDAKTIVHDSAVVLHVVDFNLSDPSPGAVTVNRGQTSGPITMQVNLLGSFPTSEVVALSCQNTPGIVNCNFSPSSVTSDMGNTVPVTLTLQTTADTTVGTSTMMIAASSQIAGSKTVTKPLTLTVTAIPDYTLVVNATSLSFPAGQQSTLNGIVTAFNGYSGTVNLTCAPGSSAPPATCTLNPTAVTATTNGTSFNLVVNSDIAGNFSFNVQGAGTPPAASDPHTASVVLTYYDFQISNTSGSQTVTAGQSATYNLSFTPQPSGGFQGTVTYSCSGLPGLSACSFDPPQISAGSGSTNVTLSITTTAPIASLVPVKKNGGFLYAMSLLLPGLVFMFAGLASGDSRRGRVAIFGVLGLLLMMSLGQTACGGGGGGAGGGSGASPHPGTIAGTYTVTVDATEAGGQPLQRSATMSLTVQ